VKTAPSKILKNLLNRQFLSKNNEKNDITIFSHSNSEEIVEYLQPVRDYLIEQVESDDVVLIQGDFGATCAMVSFVKSLGGVAVYATTKRNVVEKEIDNKIVKTSIFEHVRFRKF